jgi:signal transduction histidine kinase
VCRPTGLALAWNQIVHSSRESIGDLPSTVLDVLPLAVYVATPPGLVAYCNRAAVDLVGQAPQAGTPLAALIEDCALYRAGSDEPYPIDGLPLCRALRGEASSAEDLELRGATIIPLVMEALPIFDRSGRVQMAVATVSPRIPTRTTPAPTLGRPATLRGPDAVGDESSGERRVSRNLEAIGELAAGVAHEINTPMQYIGDNTTFLGVTLRRLLDVVSSFERLIEASRTGQPVSAELVRDCERELTRGRLPFLREQAPLAVEQMLGGVEQVRTIVQALKEFSHPGDDKAVLVDVNNLARMASTITRNAWRYAADLTLDLCECPPRVRGFPQELGQVLINLIVNAAHAVEERNAKTGAVRHGKIVIRTRSDGDRVELEVEDDGAGIPDEIRARVMEPFFTTKPAGKGTGQGLPLVRRVVEERHHGALSFDTRVGQGTCFRVVLPICEED